MGRASTVCSLATVLVLSFIFSAQARRSINIVRHGAVNDGKTDCTKAMTAAFKVACASPTTRTIVVPRGNFFLKQIRLEGPCRSPISFRIRGRLIAPADPFSQDKSHDWFNIRYINGLTVLGDGIGSMDGQGKTTWDLKAQNKSPQLMALFSLAFITNGEIRDISFVQSKNTHVNVFGCKNVTFSRVKVDSPDESPNTDGIKMGFSSDIKILDSQLHSGDDCVAILGGTVNLKVFNTVCGPGHGISVGSMGGNPNEKDITGIHINNCTLIGTMNGVRIKSWGTNNKALADDIRFENIKMENVGNPIIIDQEYCPAKNCQGAPPSHVQISNLVIANVHGTTKDYNAVNLLCSKAVPCAGVKISDVHLTYNGGKAISTCKNVKPTVTGIQTPLICAN